MLEASRASDFGRIGRLVSEGTFDAGATTVGEALGVEPRDIVDLDRFDVGQAPPEVTGRTARSAPSPYRSEAETDELLADYLEDADAGVTDAAIARKTGLSRHQVGRWRRRQGITRKSGRPPTWQRASAMAIDMFGRPRSPTVMPIASPVRSAWTPPEYLLRHPLDYDDFAELVITLVEAGFAPFKIASGIGVRERDVADACRLWAARGRS